MQRATVASSSHKPLDMRFPEADAPAPRRILTQRDVDEMRRWSANIDLARARCGRKYPRPNWEYVAELSGRGVNNVQKILKGTFVTAAEKAAKAGRARPQGPHNDSSPLRFHGIINTTPR